MAFDMVLFDSDGTLLDFTKAEEMAFYGTFVDEGINVDDFVFERYKEINSGLWEAMEQEKTTKEELVVERFRVLFAQYGYDLDPAEFNKQYLHNLSFGSFLIRGATELLESLAGKVRMAVVTNGVSTTQFRRLKESGIEKYFEAIIVSEDTGYTKPAMEFFDYTFEKLGNPDKSRTIIVGDSISADIVGGIRAGIKTCWYNPSEKTPPEGIAIDYNVKTLSEVTNIILEQKER